MKTSIFQHLAKPFQLFLVILGINAQAHSAQAEVFTGATSTKDHFNVIFHVDSDSSAAMKKTLNNIKNLLVDPRTKGKIQVELIANSKGFGIYKKGNGLEADLKALDEQGVILAECQNTLRELKVAPDSLYSFVKLVPSGMGELVIRQSEGWAYIHPSP